MSEPEERARKLFNAIMSAPYGDSTIGSIVCAETTSGRLEAAWLPIITEALSAQPRHVEAAACSDGLPDDSLTAAYMLGKYDGRKAAPQPREVRGVDDSVRRFLNSKDLYELLMNMQSGISSPGDASMANSLIRRLDKIRDSLVSTTPQDAAGVEVGGIIDGQFNEDGSLSNRIPWRVFRDDDGALWLTTDDPERDIEIDDDALGVNTPPGVDLEQFREPVIYWGAQQVMPERIAEGKRLLAIIDSNPPGVDVGKLRELVTTWQNEGIRLNGGADKPYTSAENSVRAFVLGCCADDLAAAIDAAAPGVQAND